MGAVCLAGVLDLALFVRVPALALVHPELFGHRMLHGTAVLAPHLVVCNPPVLRGGSAVLGQLRFVVNRGTGVIVFHPPGVPQVPNVHVQPLEGDARGHDAVQLVGFDLGVEQAVAQGWPVDHLGLGAGDGPMALQCCEVAPYGGGEQVSSEVVACQALQDGGALGLGGCLGLLQLLFCRLHSGLEGGELGLADALDAHAQCRLLACNELVLGFIPVLLPIAREAALADGFGACAHAGAGGYHSAVYRDLGLEADAAGQASGQLAGV